MGCGWGLENKVTMLRGQVRDSSGPCSQGLPALTVTPRDQPLPIASPLREADTALQAVSGLRLMWF